MYFQAVCIVEMTVGPGHVGVVAATSSSFNLLLVFPFLNEFLRV